MSAVREQIANVDRDLGISNIQTMEQILSHNVREERFVTLLFASFAALALLLSAIGIHGVISYVTSQRAREIGIRVALGSQSSEIIWLVLWSGLKLSLAGIVIGLGLTLLLSRFLASQLYGISATDPLTLAGVSLLLVATASLACYLPARRAAKVDPMVALRYE